MISISAIAFMLLVLAIPLCCTRVREDSITRSAVYVVLIVHQIVAFLQISIGPLPTVDADPIGFNTFAMRAGMEQLENLQFLRILRWIYDSLGGSHLLGCEINQLGFAIAIVFFIDLCCLLEIDLASPKLILIFGLLPSLALNTSVVLREGWQVCAFLALCHSFVSMKLRGPSATNLITGAMAAVTLVSLHNGFGAYVVAVVPLALLWATSARPGLVAVVLSLGLILGAYFGGRLIEKLKEKSAVVQSVAEGNGLEYIDKYQEHVKKARTDFDVLLDLSSPKKALTTGPVVLAQYLFAPFPWNVRGTKDLYGMFESAARLLFFLLALANIAKSEPGSTKNCKIFLFLMFFSLESAWSVGTSNWGTAFRHRVVAWGVLVLVGAPSLFRTKINDENESVRENVPTKKMTARGKRRALAARAEKRAQEIAARQR